MVNEEINIIFVNEITPRDDSYNEGKPFREVTFTSYIGYRKEQYGLVVFFPNDKSYTYPWHTIARLRIG